MAALGKVLEVKAEWGRAGRWGGQQSLSFEATLEGQKRVASASKILPWKDVSGWWGRACLDTASSGAPFPLGSWFEGKRIL